MVIRKIEKLDEVLETLLDMSKAWEREQSCNGYVANARSDIEGHDIFIAEENSAVLGYAFGRSYVSKLEHSCIPTGSECYEVDEIYVLSSHRSQGIGGALMHELQRYAAEKNCKYMTLSTGTKNYRAILHFYIDKIGMFFRSASLTMPLPQNRSM